MNERKLAICISGQLRTAIPAFKSFLNFFKNENYDVFIHTWFQDNDSEIDKVIELYQPKKIQIDNSPNHQRLDFNLMFRSMFLANNLKRNYEIDNDFRYDVAFRHRFDLIFAEHESMPKNTVLEKRLYVNKIDGPKMNTDYEQNGIPDLFFWGDSHTMDIMSLTYKLHSLHHDKLVIDFFENRECLGDKTISNSMLSPNQSLYKQAYRYGIYLDIPLNKDGGFIRHTLFRDEVSHLDPFNDFNKIDNFYLTQFK